MKPDPDRIHPTDDVVHKSPNTSSRHGAKLELIIVHDTEGANIKGVGDLQTLGHIFDNPNVPPAARVSCHVGTDAEGNSGRFVADSLKAWHCAFYNSVSLGIEQIGFASQTKWPEAQLQETARWIARWSDMHGIPIRKGGVSLDGRIIRSGVLRHMDLGNLGGGHHDPGEPYPFLDVLALARGYKKLL